MTEQQQAAHRAKLADIVATTLDLPPDAVTDGLSSETSENWDSVRHLTLVLAVEDAFGITFDEAEIPELTSFAALLRAVAARAGR
jgi:acyl carrier protein